MKTPVNQKHLYKRYLFCELCVFVCVCVFFVFFRFSPLSCFPCINNVFFGSFSASPKNCKTTKKNIIVQNPPRVSTLVMHGYNTIFFFMSRKTKTNKKNTKSTQDKTKIYEKCLCLHHSYLFKHHRNIVARVIAVTAWSLLAAQSAYVYAA